MAKNLIGRAWEEINPEKRVVIYADFYSVTSLEDISLEMTKSFNLAMNTKRSFFDKGLDWMKVFKKVRPIWSPNAGSDGLGEFSITTEKAEGVVNFQTIFENIHELQKKKKFEFLVILDEFQEIHNIKRAEGLLRGVLQSFEMKIPIIILGSKQHLLANIFENPKAPFYSWGATIEFHPIAYDEYHKYIEDRFKLVGKHHSMATSQYLQDKLNRIPESVNRFCDYLARNVEGSEIDQVQIDKKMEEFVERSRSIYEHIYSTLSTSERRIVEAISRQHRTSELLGAKFLMKTGNISKSTVANLVMKMLNSSLLTQGLDVKSQKVFWITDPFFNFYLKKYKSFL